MSQTDRTDERHLSLYSHFIDEMRSLRMIKNEYIFINKKPTDIKFITYFENRPLYLQIAPHHTLNHLGITSIECFTRFFFVI